MFSPATTKLVSSREMSGGSVVPDVRGLLKTRKVNCDELVDKVKNTTGAWKAGKFMPLTSRPHSMNTFCLSKALFRCSSINLRVCDLAKIGSHIKSWLYADQLEKPEELVLFRPRKQGGLSLVNMQYKALSLFIRNFMETAQNPKFQSNLYHEALYLWYVEQKRDLTCLPIMTPTSLIQSGRLKMKVCSTSRQ
jgi:hypothetical protein